ncbi:UNVERIFIED_CONTAM: hypothetical protein H355_012191 [Colinus virginianus]|nr:hypothetical protein H355_012191 [Colinus virginianus]
MTFRAADGSAHLFCVCVFTALISLSFGGAVGLMFLMLGCALPQYNEGIALSGLVPIFAKCGNWTGKIPNIDFQEEWEVNEVNVEFPFFFFSQYWPLFVLFFYILSPIPYCIARRLVDDTDATSNACKELAVFLTTGIVVSAFGLPIVFARAELIYWGSCALVLTGNTVIFATILGFFLVFGSNDDFSWQQW